MPSIAGSDIKHYFPATRGSSDATPNIGGAISVSLVPDNDPSNGIFYSIASNLLGGGTRWQYSVSFLKNTHSTDTAAAPKIWLPGSLDDNTGATVISVQGATSDFDSNFLVDVFILKNDGSHTPWHETLTGNGTTLVSGATTAQIAGIIRAICLDAITLAPVAAPCAISVYSGAQLLGIIPSGDKGATAEVFVAPAAALNTSATLTNPTTAPGVTLYKPNLVSSALALPADLAPGDKCQIYWGLRVYERANPSTFIPHPLEWQFT